MESITEVIKYHREKLNKNGAGPKKRIYISTPYQLRGIEVANKLGVPKQNYANLIKACKEDRDAFERAFTFTIDALNPHDIIRLFFWKYHQIRHDRKAKSQK